MKSRSAFTVLAIVAAAGLAGCSTNPLTGASGFQSWRPPSDAAAPAHVTTDPFLEYAEASEPPAFQSEPPGRVTIRPMTTADGEETSVNPFATNRFEPGQSTADSQVGRTPPGGAEIEPVSEVPDGSDESPATSGWRPVVHSRAAE